MIESKTKHRLDPATLRRLITECIPENITNAEELKDGFFNTTYLLYLDNGRKAVLKIAPPADIPVMRQEKDIMKAEIASIELVKKSTSIPVPSIISHIPHNKYITSPLFIMDYIDAIPLDKLIPDLGIDEITEIYRQLGRYIKELHSQHAKEFGYTLNGNRGYSTWSNAFISIIDDVLSDADDLNITLSVDASEIHRLVESYSSTLDLVMTPSLLHRDLWFGNILIKRDSFDIAAITDWERSLYGDTLMDFVFAYVEGISSFEGKVGFNEGYGRTASHTHDEIIRIELYSLYFLLLILIEGYYRGYQTKEQEDKAQAELVNTMNKLTLL